MQQQQQQGRMGQAVQQLLVLLILQRIRCRARLLTLQCLIHLQLRQRVSDRLGKASCV